MVFKLDCRVHISDPKKVADLRKLKYFSGLAGESTNPQEYLYKPSQRTNPSNNMQNNKNSNIHQAKQAMEQVRRAREANKAGEQKAQETTKRSHTFRPAVQTTSEKVEVHPGCVGLIIGRGGKNIKELIASHPGIKIQGPRRGDAKQIFRISGAKEGVAAAAAEIRSTMDNWLQRNSSRLQHEEQRAYRKAKAQDEWAQHIQDISGCTGAGWSTAGSAEADAWRKRQLGKQKDSQISYKRRPIAHKNRFEIPSDSEDEEEQRGPAIAKPRDLTGASAKGAPKEKEEAPKESKQMTAEEAEAEFAKLAAKMKPIESWADACSDDED